jgi:predicted dehydrogenase
MALKIAVIGTGPVARGNYLPYLARQRDVVLGCWNRTPAGAAEAAREFGGEDIGELADVAAWRPDAALVLVNERGRREVATQLIELGLKRIFFEKPLTAAAGQANVAEQDFLDGKALLALARAKGCETAMVFNYRFFDHCAAARAAVAARDFGAVVNVAGFVHFACWSHCLDLIRHFAGNLAEVAALRSGVIRRSEEIKTDAPDVAAAFTTAGGATGVVLGTAGALWEHPLYELTFNFERGRIQLRDLDGSLEIHGAPGAPVEIRALPPHRSRWDQYRDSFEKSLGAYLDAVRAARPPPIPGAEGLAELQIEAALRRSIAQGRPVTLAKEFPLD